MKNIKFDYLRLTQKILENFDTLCQFAKEVGMSSDSLNEKLNNKIPFESEDMDNIIQVLNVSRDHLRKYFFQLKFSVINHYKN